MTKRREGGGVVSDNVLSFFHSFILSFFLSFFDLKPFKKRTHRNYYNLNTRKTSHSKVNLLTNQQLQYSLLSSSPDSFESSCTSSAHMIKERCVSVCSRVFQVLLYFL